LSKQAGQRPASVPLGSGVPHRGQRFVSGICGFTFTVPMPASEANPEKCY
jgi:hypothetical protein